MQQLQEENAASTEHPTRRGLGHPANSEVSGQHGDGGVQSKMGRQGNNPVSLPSSDTVTLNCITVIQIRWALLEKGNT